jgi:hypothetical protein
MSRTPPPTIPALVEDLRFTVLQSVRSWQSAPPPRDRMERLADALRSRADALGRAALHNLEADPPFDDIIGQIARTMWEGMVTVEYVRAKPERRIDQMIVGAFRTSALIRNSAWGKGVEALEPPAELVAFSEEASRREKGYRDARNTLKESKLPVPGFDHDECAELPNIEFMARAIGAHDQFEVVYRVESARATHWGLHALYEESPNARLLQSTAAVAGCYRVFMANCAKLRGLDEAVFIEGLGRLLGV